MVKNSYNIFFIVIHGALRKPLLERLNEFDIVVTTYPLIVRDSDYYQRQVI